MTAPRKPAPAPGSYDAFLAEAFDGATEIIRGVKVRTPTDVPLAMQRRYQELEQSESEEALREMVALLFGDDLLEQWIEAGMGAMELRTVLAWGSAHAAGAPVTFMEAFEAVKAAEDGEGKAPNRATRRAAQRKPSTGTGGRSARTSAASTASRRTSSRA